MKLCETADRQVTIRVAIPMTHFVDGSYDEAEAVNELEREVRNALAAECINCKHAGDPKLTKRTDDMMAAVLIGVTMKANRFECVHAAERKFDDSDLFSVPDDDVAELSAQDDDQEAKPVDSLLNSW